SRGCAPARRAPRLCWPGGARHTSLPVALSSAIRALLSTLAFTTSKFLYSTGDAPEPQPLVPLPTRTCQSCLPSRSKQKTPDLPKNTYSFSPSVTGVLAV